MVFLALCDAGRQCWISVLVLAGGLCSLNDVFVMFSCSALPDGTWFEGVNWDVC